LPLMPSLEARLVFPGKERRQDRENSGHMRGGYRASVASQDERQHLPCLTSQARQGKSYLSPSRQVLPLSCETCLRSLEALSCLASRRQHLPSLPEASFASRALSRGKTLSFPGFFPGKERRRDRASRTLAREVRLALCCLPEATLAFALVPWRVPSLREVGIYAYLYVCVCNYTYVFMFVCICIQLYICIHM